MRRIKLYPHNLKAYEQAIKMLKEEGKAAIVHPTGTGKSFIAFAFVRNNQDKKFLWLSPGRYIYNLQCENLWQSQRIKLTNIEFHTYAWLMVNEESIDKLEVDYIILDEFHRSGACKWEISIKKLIDTHPQAKILGLSATKVRYLDNQRDMAEELFEGYIASEMSLCEAMALKILPEPKYVIASYAYEKKLYQYEIRSKMLKNEKRRASLEKLIERLKYQLQQADGLDKVFMKHLPKRDAKMIIFCISVDHMMEIMAQVPDWFGDIDSRPHVYQVSSHNPESEDDFKNFVGDTSEHLRLLYCIDMLNEGIHVYDVDAVVLCRPTVSPVIYKQQIGRAIAVGNGKRPVIFDLVNNFDSLYQINVFKHELTGAMEIQRNAGIDESEADILRGFEVIDELCCCRDMLEQLQKNLDASWDIYYQELSHYIKEYGDSRVRKDFKTECGLRLGIWLTRQRKLYRENRLLPEYVTALEKIGVEWDYKNESVFKKKFECLRRYKEEKGNLLVSPEYISPEGIKLGVWCDHLRQVYRTKKISEERVRMLTDLGFVWEPYEAMWEAGYRHAEEYYSEHGNLGALRKYVCKDGFKLGIWIYTQRNVRLGRESGKLTAERIAKLDRLNMEWEDKRANSTERYLAAYKKYIAEGGDKVISSTYVTDEGVRLGAWSTIIRSNYYLGKLKEEKIKMLTDAGFYFHRYPYVWYVHYKEAKQYFDTYGDILIKHTYIVEHGGSLNQWVNVQKREYDKEGHGTLCEEQVRLLEEIHIGKEYRFDARFMKGLNAYKEYIKQTDSVFVPCQYRTKDGYPLGKWIKSQKWNYKRGILSEEKILALTNLGMVWENVITLKAREHWDTMYRAAEKYAETYGSIRNIPGNYITKDGKKLGDWVGQQRRIRKGSIQHSIKMTNKRIVMLDLLGINWGKIE